MTELESEHQQNLTKSWRAVSITVISISAAFYLITQGSHVEMGPLVEKVSAYSAAVYGLLFLVPLTAFFYAYTYHAVDCEKHKKWYERLPVIIELHLPSGNPLLKKVQISSIVIIFFLPMFTLGHCYLKSLDGRIYIKDSCSQGVCTEEWSSGKYEALAPSKFIPFKEIFTNGNGYRYDGQITYFPGWQPALFLVFVLWSFYLWLKTLKRLLFVNPFQNTA